MEIYRFDKKVGKKIIQFNSDFVISRIINNTDSKVHIGCVYLDANGVIGYHQAVVPQLLLILDGEGQTSGEEKITVKVKKGDAVFWHKDEWHETTSEKGLTAIVIEGEELDPSLSMPKTEGK